MGSSQSSLDSPSSSHSKAVTNDEVLVDEKSVSNLASQLESTQLNFKQPTSLDGSLSLKNVESWEDVASRDPKTQLARTVLHHTDFKTALTSRDTAIADQHVFNLQLDFKTDPITNQKSSGRCWLFATTNVLRYSVMQKLGLKEFQLSQVGGRVYLRVFSFIK